MIEQEKHKLEIVPEYATTTHIYLDGKELKHIRAYKIEQKAGKMPKVTIELNGYWFKYELDKNYYIHFNKTNIFKRVWESFKMFCNRIIGKYNGYKARKKGN